MRARRRHLTPSDILRSAGLYPITTMYFAGVAATLVAVLRLATVPVCLTMFGIIAVFAVSWAALKELHAVHVVVDQQRAELLGRIDELVALLNGAGVSAPPPPLGEQEARNDEHNRRATHE